MTEIRDDTFTDVLVGDVIAAENRIRATDNPTHRRDLIRAASAAIEGLHWQLKQDVLRHARDKLTVHEHAAMAQQSYTVDKQGNVEPVPRFLPLTTAIRLVVQIVRRYRPTYNVDFGHPGWANLNHAIEVRNRLVHPKTLEDLTVSDTDIQKTMSGFCWILALVIEVLRETHASLKDYYPDTPTTP